ncbi:MAG: PepSY-associated TM helix domain-containing protein [Pseudomonadota bacterium]
MKQSLRQSMSVLHTWSGLIVGWLLFAIFLTGTCAYFQEEITKWMQPELTTHADSDLAAINAVEYLQETAPDAQTWFIGLPDDRKATTRLFWRPGENADPSAPTRAVLDGQGAAAEIRDTQGGFFLYRFHFDLHYMPAILARYLVGIAAMTMLIAIISGVITHKKIFIDFFTLRFGKGQRSWLDAHNMSAVFALPFFLMITYTGLVTLASMYMPFAITANYKSAGDFFQEAFFSPDNASPSGMPAEMAPMSDILRVAAQRWDGAKVGDIRIISPNDENAIVVLRRSTSEAIGDRSPQIILNGVTGALIKASPDQSAALATESFFVGLHAGRYADWGLRWLYFLSGLGGATMIGTGLVLWTNKRALKNQKAGKTPFGFWLVERLNIATLVGLPAGLAVFFLANRLLPLDMENRSDWEINFLFIVWAGAFVWAAGRPARRAWAEMLGLSGGMFLLVPIVNAATTSRNLFVSLGNGDWVFAGFDAAMLFFASAFGYAAFKCLKVKRPAPRPVLNKRAGLPAE